LDGTLASYALVNDQYRFVSLLDWDGVSSMDYFVSAGAAVSPIINKKKSNGYSEKASPKRTELLIDLRKE
jgi:hypothetical protein